MQKITKIITYTALVFIIGVFYVSLSKNSNYDTKNLIGEKIPQAKLKSFDGVDFLASEILTKNNYTLVNFWASWCGPCKIEHPILMKLSKEKNLHLLGINYKDKKKTAKIFLKNYGNPFDKIAVDPLGKQSVTFGIYGIPESILVKKKKIVLKKYLGPLTSEDYKEILKILN